MTLIVSLAPSGTVSFAKDEGAHTVRQWERHDGIHWKTLVLARRYQYKVRFVAYVLVVFDIPRCASPSCGCTCGQYLQSAQIRCPLNLCRGRQNKILAGTKNDVSPFFAFFRLFAFRRFDVLQVME